LVKAELAGVFHENHELDDSWKEKGPVEADAQEVMIYEMPAREEVAVELRGHARSGSEITVSKQEGKAEGNEKVGHTLVDSVMPAPLAIGKADGDVRRFSYEQAPMEDVLVPISPPTEVTMPCPPLTEDEITPAPPPRWSWRDTALRPKYDGGGWEERES
jgi:hypothetical protein